MVVLFLSIAATGLALCGMGYYALSSWSAYKFARRLRQPEPFSPPLSILKPLRGIDPEMYLSFRSHCLQHYPEFEIIFGVSSADDPAAGAVQRLMREFPERHIRLVVCPEVLGNNRKVSNLIQMLPYAQHDYILINDSDIHVPQDYLRQVMAEFGDAGAGMVTCPYRGVPKKTLGSRLEALGISTDFIPGVLTARQIEGGLHFGLGSTLAVSRKALEAIGGLDPLVNYLADDFQLGKRIADAGFKVLLANVTVETHLPAYRLSEFLRHQLRWARSTRDSRRAGYMGLIFTFGLAWAILAVVLAKGAWWSWLVLAAAALLRAMVALQIGERLLGDRGVRGGLWLLPLRDLIALGVWFASLAGRTVHWRGEVFTLEGGKIHLSGRRAEDLTVAGPEQDKMSAGS